MSKSKFEIEEGYSPAEDDRTWFQRIVTSFLRYGKIPKHVGLILDGNRTYAKKIDIEVVDGHKAGAKKFAAVLNWFARLGVNEVTAYAFSIENFKRSSEQVNALHQLFEDWSSDMLADLDKVHREGIRIRIIGDWKLMRKSVTKQLAKIMYETKDNKNYLLNVAYAYTSTNELLRAVMDIEDGIQNKILHNNDITVDLFDKLIKVKSVTQPVDLLIRTSGVTRLSDFMLWQSSFATLYFTEVLWPDLSYWDISKAIYFYQRQIRSSEGTSVNAAMECDANKEDGSHKIEPDARVEEFLRKNELEYWTFIKDLSDSLL